MIGELLRSIDEKVVSDLRCSAPDDAILALFGLKSLPFQSFLSERSFASLQKAASASISVVGYLMSVTTN